MSGALIGQSEDKNKGILSWIKKTQTLGALCSKAFCYAKLKVFNRILKQSFLFFVLLPMALYGSYMLLWQSPLYESQARITIENNDVNNTLMLNIGFMGQSASDEMRSAYLTKSFIESYDMLQHLNKRLGYKELVSSKSIDFFSRLSRGSSHQEQLDYFKKMVSVSFDQETNELFLSMKAFNLDDPPRLLAEIIDASKNFANHISNSLALKRYEFSKKQLENYKEKLYLSEVDLIKFQNEHGIFDPKETAKEISMVMAKLKEKLVSKQTELLTLSAFMQPKASKIISLKEEISALKKQLEEQTSILIGQNHNETLNTLLADYQWKELSLKFASAEYEAAQKAFELASLDVSKQQNILVILSPPTKPDVKSEPQILFNLMVAFMGLGLLYVIIKMAWLIIEEHTD